MDEVTGETVWCDGGQGPQGHPKVYLNFSQGSAVCPYCSRHFHKGPGLHAK